MKDWALVTGAALRVGRECALTLGKAGFNLFLHYRHSKEAVEELSFELQRLGCQSCCLARDFQEPAEVDSLLRALEAYPIKVVVNNAAVFIPDSPWEQDERVLQRQLQINYHAPLKIMQWVEKTQKDVTVINFLDGRLESSLGQFYSYGLSKTMAQWATRSFAAQTKSNRYYGVAPKALLPPVVSEQPPTAEKDYHFTGTAVLEPILKEIVEGQLPNGTIITV